MLLFFIFLPVLTYRLLTLPASLPPDNIWTPREARRQGRRISWRIGRVWSSRVSPPNLSDSWSSLSACSATARSRWKLSQKPCHTTFHLFEKWVEKCFHLWLTPQNHQKYLQSKIQLYQTAALLAFGVKVSHIRSSQAYGNVLITNSMHWH